MACILALLILVIVLLGYIVYLRGEIEKTSQVLDGSEQAPIDHDQIFSPQPYDKIETNDNILEPVIV